MEENLSHTNCAFFFVCVQYAILCVSLNHIAAHRTHTEYRRRRRCKRIRFVRKKKKKKTLLCEHKKQHSKFTTTTDSHKIF